MPALEKQLYRVQLRAVYILNSSRVTDIMIIKEVSAHSKFAAENEGKKMVKDALNKEAIIVAIDCESVLEVKQPNPVFCRKDIMYVWIRNSLWE